MSGLWFTAHRFRPHRDGDHAGWLPCIRARQGIYRERYPNKSARPIPFFYPIGMVQKGERWQDSPTAMRAYHRATRISTGQLDALTGFGVERARIYADKASGRDFERSEYRRLVEVLDAGDVLAVKSIDRLGRNYEEVIEQWRLLTKELAVDWWFWICRCSTPVQPIMALREPLSRIWCCSF